MNKCKFWISNTVKLSLCDIPREVTEVCSHNTGLIDMIYTVKGYKNQGRLIEMANKVVFAVCTIFLSDEAAMKKTWSCN